MGDKPLIGVKVLSKHGFCSRPSIMCCNIGCQGCLVKGKMNPSKENPGQLPGGSGIWAWLWKINKMWESKDGSVGGNGADHYGLMK